MVHRQPGLVSARRTLWLGSRRWLGATAVAGAATLIAVAGCSSGASSGAKTTTGGTAGGGTVSAHQAIRLAASASERVNSLTATLSVSSSGGQVSGLTGDMKIQLKPSPLIAADFNVSSAGSPQVNIAEILTGDAIYFKDPSLTKLSGKPWIKIGFSQLGTKLGLSFSSLVQNLENSNPLAQARLFTASKDVHAVGTSVVGGVQTTEYAGSYQPGAALNVLSPQLRKLAGPLLKTMGAKAVSFEVWIDGQHLIRKAVTHETVNGQAVTSVYNVTSVNQPITVTLPPAGEISSLPRL
jgi:hypothetical protein